MRIPLALSNIHFALRNILGNISELVTWQTLGAIGRSNVGRATVAMPFIGYLIVFNPTFVEFFGSTLPVEGAGGPAIIVHLHEFRLSFLYFGLLFLGLGILLYLGFSPTSVRNFRVVSEYISEMESVSSDSLVKQRLGSIISDFRRLNKGEAASPFFSGQHPSFPGKASDFFHDLISDLIRKLDIDSLPIDLNEIPPGTMFQNSRHVIWGNDGGYIVTNDFLNLADSTKTVHHSVFSQLFSEAPNFSKQVYFLDYYSSDYSRHRVRFTISFFYVLAFAMLAVPTITTSVLVISATFSGS